MAILCLHNTLIIILHVVNFGTKHIQRPKNYLLQVVSQYQSVLDKTLNTNLKKK